MTFSVASSDPAANMEQKPPLERARALEPVIRQEAEPSQELRQMTDRMTAALKESGLFRMNVPVELGGEDLDMHSRVDVIEELTRADGSIGWTFMAIAGYLGYVGAGVGDAAAKDIFSDPDVLLAGMGNPVGSIVEEPEGYRVKGTYKFGSGVPQSTWIAAGGQLNDGSPDGSQICCVVPTSTATLKGGWNPTGLVGTGSVDYEIPERVVDKDYSFNVGNYVAQRGGPSGRMDFVSTAMVYHSSVALGVTKRALEEVVAVADSGKQRPGQGLLADQQMFNHDFSRHEGAIKAARAYLGELIDDGLASIERGEQMTPMQTGRFRQVAALIHRVATEAVEFAFFWGGSASLRKPTALGRCKADIHAMNNHILVDHSNFIDTAPTIMETYR